MSILSSCGARPRTPTFEDENEDEDDWVAAAAALRLGVEFGLQVAAVRQEDAAG